MVWEMPEAIILTNVDSNIRHDVESKSHNNSFHIADSPASFS